MNSTKSFRISKLVVMEAYKRVKANRGSAGVDGESIEEFEKDLKDNLYKIWNRMSSGTYFPPAVKQVEIPKSAGGVRKLGIPTVSDRIAQMVVKCYLEPKLEPVFHDSSYGYRPGRSPLQAVAKAREWCFRYPWVMEFDIKGLFDNIDHELLMKAVRKHTSEKWIILYIERWLKAPFQTSDGKIINRVAGTPQGGVISPLLANLFLHYGFDMWMSRTYPHLPFERFADDGVIHCRSQGEAKHVMAFLGRRLKKCKLEMHPEKSSVVYCKDARRDKEYPNTKFMFLGYEFRTRICKGKNGVFVGFTPAASPKAKKLLMAKIRMLKLPYRTDASLEDIQKLLDPIVRGWLNYFGAYNQSSTNATLMHVNLVIIKWAKRKFKRLKSGKRKARKWLRGIYNKTPVLFTN